MILSIKNKTTGETKDIHSEYLDYYQKKGWEQVKTEEQQVASTETEEETGVFTFHKKGRKRKY